MTLQLDDSYHIWKIKLELAQEGSVQALEEIKSHVSKTQSEPEFEFVLSNFHEVLLDSQIKYLKEQETIGSYELYSEFPIFLLLQGQAEVRCLNLQGDEQAISKHTQQGICGVSKAVLSQKFGQNNITIVTKFELVASKRCILIQIGKKIRQKVQGSALESQEKVQVKSQVTIRQETIMKKYMLFPLQYIRIEEHDSADKKYEEKIYLLEGKACYYYDTAKRKELLTVYEEGYFNPKQFLEKSAIKLYIFEGSKILIFEEEFMRDDVVASAEAKRETHIESIIARYEKMSSEQKHKVFVKLINHYKLNKKQVERDILGLKEQQTSLQNIRNLDKSVSKRPSTKNDLIATSSSIKQKCKIRISKKKKIM